MRNLAAQLGHEGLQNLADCLADLWSGLDNTELVSSVSEKTLDATPEATELAYWDGF
ncbi:hypothetical protein [Belnapia sp. F-4-1]|uniref:hypothetical protein n=1 Tax=Belnapia sp. F-4-1 TaxID=1545443 RepID=UPI001364C49B|nr:hypothetical protein [Belnapia sp. F-4-1]